MPTNESENRPHRSRRKHQAALKRKRSRRQARVRRLKAVRAVLGLRFWTRATVGLVIALALVFWAKFALVYDIPQDLAVPQLQNVAAYITTKPWWFGPPVFDLANIEQTQERPYMTDVDALIEGLGRYQHVVLSPTFVWTMGR